MAIFAIAAAVVGAVLLFVVGGAFVLWLVQGAVNAAIGRGLGW